MEVEKRIRSVFIVVATVFLALLAVFVFVLISNEVKRAGYIGLESDHLRTIEVHGEGEVSAAPDVAEIYLSVITQEEDSEEALNENNEKTENVISYLKEEGVEEDMIQTSGFDMRPLYDHREDERTGERERVIYAYEARNTVEVEFKDLEDVGSLIDGAIRAGANEVKNLRFSIENEEEYKSQAREEAIREAEDRAESIAASLEVSLGRVLDFSEDKAFYRTPFMEADMREVAMEDVAEEEVPIEPGESEITSSVIIEYEIR